jgi:hypothetical protein
VGTFIHIKLQQNAPVNFLGFFEGRRPVIPPVNLSHQYSLFFQKKFSGSSIAKFLRDYALFFRRHRHFLMRTDHLLEQSHLIPPVEEMKLNPVFLDCRMELHGHIRLPEMDIPGPDRSSRHEEPSIIIQGQAGGVTL